MYLLEIPFALLPPLPSPKCRLSSTKTLEVFYFACCDCIYLCFGFSGDNVFMPNKAECEEYVLEEFGIIFAGNNYHINSFGWNFGQVNTALNQQPVLCALFFT